MIAGEFRLSDLLPMAGVRTSAVTFALGMYYKTVSRYPLSEGNLLQNHFGPHQRILIQETALAGSIVCLFLLVGRPLAEFCNTFGGQNGHRRG
jgi:hypothetical protein